MRTARRLATVLAAAALMIGAFTTQAAAVSASLISGDNGMPCSPPVESSNTMVAVPLRSV